MGMSTLLANLKPSYRFELSLLMVLCSLGSVLAQPTIDSQPVSSSVCPGGSTSISVAVDKNNCTNFNDSNNPIYTWQFSLDNGLNWTTIAPNSPSGFSYNQARSRTGNSKSTSTLTINVSADVLAGAYLYRCVITGSGCTGSRTTNNATITVNPLPSLSTASLASPVCDGSPATINLSGLVPSTTFSVNYTINGIAQTPVTGRTSNASGVGSFNTGNLSLDNNTLRVTGITITSATPNCTRTFSTDVPLVVNPRPTSIITGTQEICIGSTAQLSIALAGTPPWNLTYSDGVTPIPVNGIGSSPYVFNVSPTVNRTYTVTALSDANCVSQSGDRTGSAAITVVNPVPTFTAQPGAQSCYGVDITYTTQAGQTSYLWDFVGLSLGTDYTITSGSTSNTSNTVTVRWITTGPKTVTVTYSSPAPLFCPAATTASSTTEVLNATVPLQPTPISPANLTVCTYDAPIVFSAPVDATATLYNWSFPSGWSLEGQTTRTVTATPSASSQSGTITVIASNFCGSSLPASTTITVNSATPGTIAANQAFCAGAPFDPAPLTSTTDGTGSGTIAYRWESSVSPFSTWTQVQLGPSATYDPGSITVTTHYRRTTISTLSGKSCSSSPTASVIITANEVSAGTFTDQLIEVCDGGRAYLLAPSTGTGLLTYQWQSSTSAGGTYTDIAGATENFYVTTIRSKPSDIYYKVVTTSTIGSNSCPATSNYVQVSVPNTVAADVQKQTFTDGNWSGNIWSPSGTPGQAEGALGKANTAIACPVMTKHIVTLNQDLTIKNGVYFLNSDGDSPPVVSATVVDPYDLDYYKLSIEAGGNYSNNRLEVAHNTANFEGGAYINDGTLYVRAGAILKLGPLECQSNTVSGTTYVYNELGQIADHALYGNSDACNTALASIAQPVTISGQNGGNYNATFLIDNSTRIIVEGTLVVYGNLINRNNGSGKMIIGNTGNIYIYGDYIADRGNTNVAGADEINGNIISSGAMVTLGGSTIFNSTNDCLDGPCDGRALAACVQFSISTGTGSSAQEFCAPTTPLPLVIDPGLGAGFYAYQWFKSTESAGIGFVAMPDEIFETLTFSAPVTETTWYRLRITKYNNQEKTDFNCDSYSNPVILFVGNWLGKIPTTIGSSTGDWDNTENWWFDEGGCVNGIPNAGRNAIISRGVNFMPEIVALDNKAVNDLTLNAGTSIKLNPSTKLDLYGLLTIAANAIFDADGDGTAVFTVKSTSVNTEGRIGLLPATGGLTGNVTVERFIPPSSPARVNRYISIPVSNVIINSIGNLQAWYGTKLGYYDESVVGDPNQGYKYLASNYATPLSSGNTKPNEPGRGYLAYNSGNLRLSFIGPLSTGNNRGNVSLPVSFTPYTEATWDGWNLVGNPYPSPIVWSGALSDAWPAWANIEPMVYITDMASSPPAYRSVSANGTIAMGQAFWVKATGANPALTISENAKVTATQAATTFYREKSEQGPVLDLVISNGEETDHTYLFLTPDATAKYDMGKDATKFPFIPMRIGLVAEGYGPLFQYHTSDLNVDQIPVEVVVPEPGDYTITVSQIAASSELSGFVLKDLFTNTIHELKSGSSIPFTVTSHPSSSGSRFALVRGSEVAIMSEPVAKVYPNPVKDVLFIEFYSPMQVGYQLFNASGMQILEGAVESSSGIAHGKINMSELPAGLYILRSYVDGKQAIHKVIKL
jgi:hypothetical protein